MLHILFQITWIWIRGVQVDGVLFEESDVTDQVVDFYKKLYQDNKVTQVYKHVKQY